jgi:hypothetical protein
MAGIFGYLRLTEKAPGTKSIELKSTTGKLIDHDDLKLTFHESDIGFFSSASLEKTKTSNCLEFQDHIILYEGDISLSPKVNLDDFKSSENFSIENSIIRLFEKFKFNLGDYLTGNFNLFIINKKNKEAVLMNGQLGMLPLFYHFNSEFIVFSSKILPIVESKLLNVEWDVVSQYEQIIFNYILSDHTFIKGVKTLKSGSYIALKRGKVETRSYWTPKQLFGNDKLNYKQSLDSIYDSFDKSVLKAFQFEKSETNKIGLSLTGGWDGRLVLSYVLKNKLESKINLYSFGAVNSSDIYIPEAISNELGLEYNKIPLDNQYINKSFPLYSKKTIELSNGYRPYLRSHYLHTFNLLSKNVSLVLSGNCGSNILKFGLIKPGTVVNKNLLDLIQSEEPYKAIDSTFKNYQTLLKSHETDVIDELSSRVKQVFYPTIELDSQAQKYFYLLLSLVERKYFGNEIATSNDYVYNYSPFIDLPFLETLSRTKFWGEQYPFNSNSLKLRKMSTDLYSELIRRNSNFLWTYPTDRNISFKELSTTLGKIKIIKSKFFKKKKQETKFNTNTLESEFHKIFSINIPEYLTKEEKANFHSSSYFKEVVLSL